MHMDRAKGAPPFRFGCFYCPQITANKMAMTAKPC